MTINQHNYEEFFLLYADGELPAADRQAVEQFVQGNPGLAGELDMFMRLRMPDEPVFFAGKELLYKNGSTGISLDNYEENFLLYVDNELASDSKEQVETFVLQHPALQDEFTLLKQTRLEPELLSFPNKDSLYRQEKEKKLVFYMRWQRIAVAAAFIGLAILLWTVIPGNKNATQQTLAQQTPAVKSGSTTQQAQVPVIVQKKADVGNKAPESTGTGNIAAANLSKSPVLINTDNKQSKNRMVDNGKIPEALASAQAVTPLIGPSSKADPVTEKTEIAGIEPPAQEHSVNKVSPTPLPPINSEEAVTASLIKPAVYKELDTDDEKKSLYLGSIEINKDKLRGFFRKAGSIFRSKTRQQEEERSETSPANTRSLK